MGRYRIKAFLLLACALQMMPVFGQPTTLKDAFRDYWRMSISVNQWQVKAETPSNSQVEYTGMVGLDQTSDWDMITRHFGWVVAENCMKCEVIHPKEGVYDFTLADQFVDKARAAGL